MLINSICFADSTATTTSTASTQQTSTQTSTAVDEGAAPMAINPNTGQPYRSPFLHGTFASVSATELIIKGRTHHEPITFQLKGSIPVYEADRKPISLSNLLVGDHLKVHFQKNPDQTMTALAIYRVKYY